MESAASHLQAHSGTVGSSSAAGSPERRKSFSHAHAVQFYDDDAFLTSIVGAQLVEALSADRPAIVIATPEHRTVFSDYLRRARVDVEAARDAGKLTMLDAARTLERFMDGRIPSPARFESSMGALIESVLRGRRDVALCAYGEMVNLLLASRNAAGALRVEQLWNDLARKHDFTLLCAYRMENFSRAEDVASFQAICAEHTHVAPAETYAPADDDHRMREISKLQQRARALESEIAERARLEQALRSTVRALRSSEEEQRAARAAAEQARAEADEARRIAEHANNAKSDFLAVMSHELRTPLNAIGGYAELLELGIHGAVTTAQRNALERIGRSQRVLLGLVNQVLNFARLDAGTIRFNPTPVRIADVLGTVEALVAPQFLAKRLRYECAGCDPELVLTVDQEKLEQILLNLLTNALKFTDEQGCVSLTLRADASTVSFAVADTGIGIPADMLATIFDPFVQVDANFARSRDGVGLGLAISRDLARRMGGDLVVESTRGAGSTFTLTLPRV